MIKSEQINELVKALVKVQAKVKGAVKDSSNPFFKSKYADLNSVLESAQKAGLNEEGLAIIQGAVIMSGAETQLVMETTLLHTSGQYITHQMPMPVAKANDPQALGSAVTYARRYGYQAILGMGAEDDDGNKASAKEAPKAFVQAVGHPEKKAETTDKSSGLTSSIIGTAIAVATSVEELTKLVPSIQKEKASMKPEEYEKVASAFREKKLELSKKA